MSSGALKNNAFQIATNIIKDDLHLNESNFLSDIIHKMHSDKNPIKDKQDYLTLLNKIRFSFLNCEELSPNQKFDFCSIERYIMKLYLKDVVKEYK